MKNQDSAISSLRTLIEKHFFNEKDLSALQKNRVTFLSLWLFKTISCLQKASQLEPDRLNQYLLYCYEYSCSDVGFFWRESFSKQIKSSRVLGSKSKFNIKGRIKIAQNYLEALKVVIFRFFSLLGRRKLIVLSRARVSAQEIELTGVETEGAYFLSWKGAVPPVLSTHNCAANLKFRGLLKEFLLSLHVHALYVEQRKGIKVLIKSLDVLLPGSFDSFFEKPFFQFGGGTQILNFSGDMLISRFLSEIVFKGYSGLILGVQHGGGYREFATFNIIQEVYSYPVFLFQKYERIDDSQLVISDELLMGFKQGKGVFYPQGAPASMTEAVTSKEQAVQVEADRESLTNLLKGANFPVWIKPHPVTGGQNSWHNVEVLEGGVNKSGISSRHVTLVIIDYPGSTLALDCIKKGIRIVYVFDPDLYRLSEWARGYFSRCEKNGYLFRNLPRLSQIEALFYA